MFIMNYIKGEVVLLKYPYTHYKIQKVRPAVVLSKPGKFNDIFVIPLTSRTSKLDEGEFILDSWKTSGLNVPSAVKRGCYLIHEDLIIKKLNKLGKEDISQINNSLKLWLKLE